MRDRSGACTYQSNSRFCCSVQFVEISASEKWRVPSSCDAGRGLSLTDCCRCRCCRDRNGVPRSRPALLRLRLSSHWVDSFVAKGVFAVYTPSSGACSNSPHCCRSQTAFGMRVTSVSGAARKCMRDGICSTACNKMGWANGQSVSPWTNIC